MSDTNDFTSHTPEQIAEMLSVIGVRSVDDLFVSIPEKLRINELTLPRPMSEPEVARNLKSLAAKNRPAGSESCFMGGGFYDHYVPAVVSALASRGEFATAYTPYQAEASQGTLGYLFEFQTMIAGLFGFPAANASMYDAATACVEAVNLVGAKRVVVAAGVNPRYSDVLKTYAAGLGVTVEFLQPTDFGNTASDITAAARPDTCFVIQQPNRWGFLEDVNDLAQAAGDCPIVAVCDPISLGVLTPPGEWGAAVAVAEGQAVGNPLAYGGQCVGLFACAERYIRKMPGRLVGETQDSDGNRGYVLTLQAREQHIRREKAGSNICTNQSLFALMVTLYLAWLGPRGLEQVAALSNRAARRAAERITESTPFDVVSHRPFLREFAVQSEIPAADVLAHLKRNGIFAGPIIDEFQFNLAFTERVGDSEIDQLVDSLGEVPK